MRSVNDGGGNVAFMLDTDENSLRAQREYWTPERIAGAIPVLPEGPAAPRGMNAVGMATDPVLADLGKMPFCAVGKLYFSDRKYNYVASASIYGERELLLTAAHCVRDSDSAELYEHFLFRRCYDVGRGGAESSAEELTLKTVALKEAWVGAGNDKWQWDYSIAILNGRSSLATPLTHGAGNAKKVRAIGYPTNYYDGKKMVYVDGDTGAGLKGTLFIKGDKMGPGCSGGPWLDGSGIVVGVNSYKIGSERSSLYGIGSPILNDKFESLYQYVLTLI